MLFKGSFEDFIYIIIGLVWIVFSIYKGAQKNKARKKTTTPSDPESKKTTSIFDSFLENIMKDEEATNFEPVELQPNKDEEVEIKKVESEKIFSYDDLVEESNYLSKTDVYEEKAVTTTSTLNQELRTHLKQAKTKPRFDLRKAIIYSEILNRPDF